MNAVRSIIIRFPWVITMCFAAILVVSAARMHELWGDEAETALFARNILKYGVPKGWDGTNIMGINNAVVLDSNLINHTSPWAQYYMVAASFAVFGQSSFTARIPSMILYVLTIPLLYYITLRITGKKSVAFLATLIAALSVKGTLFGFQARYYQLTNVCGLLFFISAYELLEKKRWPVFMFIFSGTVFFYANYVSWVAFYIAVFAVLVLRSMITKQDTWLFVNKFLLYSVGIVMLCAPWYIIMKPFDSRGEIKINSLHELGGDFYHFSYQAWYLFHNSNVFPAGMAMLMGLVVGLRIWKKKTLSVLGSLSGVIVLYLAVMALFTTVAYVDTIFIQARYTTVMFPFFYILIAMVISDVIAWKKAVGWGFLVLLCFTNILAGDVRHSYALQLAHEIVSPYQTPEILVANYLKEFADKGDTAFVNFDRDHEPLIFFLDDHIRFVNRVTPINNRIFPKNRKIIPRYIYDFRGQPEWVILYSKRIPDGTFYTSDFRPLWMEVDLAKDYDEHIIPVFFSDLSRPEIEIRSFVGVPTPDPIDYVYIYKKK